MNPHADHDQNRGPSSHPQVSVVALQHVCREVASEIVTLQRAAYALEAELIGTDAIPPLHETIEQVQGLTIALLGIRIDGRVAAMLGYQRDRDAVDIDRLAVHPDHSRQGLARKLLKHLHACESDAARFTVSTGRDNLPAVMLYEGMGYHPIGDLEVIPGLVVRRFERLSRC
jgi:ribosomal protein S18 acetylase RimI-like enzyme